MGTFYMPFLERITKSFLCKVKIRHLKNSYPDAKKKSIKKESARLWNIYTIIAHKTYVFLKVRIHY